MDYCSTTAGATLVADHSPESSKIVAWAHPVRLVGHPEVGQEKRRSGKVLGGLVVATGALTRDIGSGLPSDHLSPSGVTQEFAPSRFG